MTEHERFKAWFYKTMNEEWRDGPAMAYDAGLIAGYSGGERSAARHVMRLIDGLTPGQGRAWSEEEVLRFKLMREITEVLLSEYPDAFK